MTQGRMPDGWTIRLMRRWREKELAEEEPASAAKRFEAGARSVLLAGVCMAASAGILVIWIASGVAEGDVVRDAFAAGFALVGVLLMGLGAALRSRRSWARRIAVASCFLGVLSVTAFLGWFWIGASGLLWEAIAAAPLWSLDRARWFYQFAFASISCLVVMAVASLLAWKLWESMACLASDDAKRICGEINDGAGTENRPREGAEG